MESATALTLRRNLTRHIGEPWGLRQRLALALAIPLVIIAVASSSLDFYIARQTADSVHDAVLAETVFDLEAHFRAHDKEIVVDLSEEVEAMIRSSAPDTLHFSVQDKSGKVLAGDSGLPEFATPASSEVFFTDGVYQGENIRAAIHRFQTTRQELTVLVLETTRKRQASRQRILQAMVWPNAIVITATLLVIWLAVRQGLLPLHLVEREIGSRSANDLREIDPTTHPKEIRPMLKRLNELFGMLREAYAVQQRFIGDAAHQLRTPLAGLQTQIDLAIGERIFDRHPERLARLEEATDRIKHLLSQLLVFARAETALPLLNTFEEVALEEIVEQAATTFLDASLEKQIDLGFEIAPAHVWGIPWLLNEAIGNLIDNALRYTLQGGVVTVRCGRDGKNCFLEVEDSGTGIPADQMSKVLERFYRVPGSPGDGCGLGLAIVHEIVGLHGASISLTTVQTGGLNVQIAFLADCEPPQSAIRQSENVKPA